MKRRGHYVNILMPSKAGFYQPYGYELYCHQWKETLPLEALRPLTDRTVRYAFVNSSDQWPYLAAIYEGYTKGLSGYALRDEKSWRSHIDAQLGEGNIAVCFDGDRPIGYAFYQLGQRPSSAVNSSIPAAKAKAGLLGYMYNHRSQGEAFQWNEGIHDQSYRFYPDGKSGHETMPFMTGRIVDVKGALEQQPYRADGTITFHTEDPLADWNCGTFTLTVTNGRGIVTREMSKTADVTMPIGTLALLVFGAMDVNDLVFNEKLQGSDQGFDVLQKLFPTEKNWINEWY